MAVSPARVEANRKNSLKSTGPRTERGKAASRRNSLKHGMTGMGVVISGEDHREITTRCEALAAQLAPEGDPMGLILANRVAMLSVRSERCARHERAVTAERVRLAADVFDEDRRARADHLLSFIGQEPATHVRQLRTMPEGIDLLIIEFLKLRDVALLKTNERWVNHHGWRVDQLLGNRPGERPHTRCEILSQSIEGHFDELDPQEIEGLDMSGKCLYALDQMVKMIDGEIARLEAIRSNLDFDKIAQSRAEATERALIDSSPEAILARKYEAATERSMFRAIKEIRVFRQERANLTPPSTQQVQEARQVNAQFLPEMMELNRPLASFFPESRPYEAPIDLPELMAAKVVTNPYDAMRFRRKRPKLPT